MVRACAEVRSQLAAKEQECRKLALELSRLKSKAQAEGELLVRTTVEQFPGVFSVYDAKRRFRYVSAETARMSGLSPEQMVGRRDEELVPAELCRQYLPVLKRAYKTKQPQSLELDLPGQYGRVTQAVRYVPVLGKNGVIRYMISIAIDITGCKRAGEALQKSEGRLRLKVETVEDYAIFMLDPKGDIVSWNTGGEQIKGYKADEAIGRNFSIFYTSEDAERGKPQAELNTARRVGRVEDEGWRVRKDGSRFWANTIITALRNDAGDVKGFLKITRDLSERKQAEEALRQSESRLATALQRVAERTELAESRARQLQALAVELVEAEERERRRVAQLLHDDLQQLLAAARMQLQAAVEILPPLPMLDMVERLIEDSISKSRRLSHELSPPVLHHSGLVAALQWLVRQMRIQFGLRVELEVRAEQKFESAPLKVFLFRAVQELLFNIVKHAGVNGARVMLSGGDGILTITVSDQGRGFDPESVDFSNTKAGLGLLSLRERARHIGGGLVIDSAPGHGSRFTLTMPLSLPGTDESQQLSADPQADTKVDRNRPAAIGTRVLFADDHKVMRQGLISLIVGQPDIQIVGEAANGRQAVEQARQLKPDVVVMDVSMPEMDGVEATRLIKAELPEVRVIGLSMFDDEQIARTMRLAGAEAFVNKSASSAELLQAIYGISRRGQRLPSEELPAAKQPADARSKPIYRR